jgi:hypothetical protein
MCFACRSSLLAACCYCLLPGHWSVVDSPSARQGVPGSWEADMRRASHAVFSWCLFFVFFLCGSVLAKKGFGSTHLTGIFGRLSASGVQNAIKFCFDYVVFFLSFRAAFFCVSRNEEFQKHH